MIRSLFILSLLITIIGPFTIDDDLFIPSGIVTLVILLIDLLKKKWLDKVVIIIIWGLFSFYGYAAIMISAWGGEKELLSAYILIFIIFIVLLLLTKYNQKINHLFKKNYK
jgi:hypothetical protein